MTRSLIGALAAAIALTALAAAHGAAPAHLDDTPPARSDASPAQAPPLPLSQPARPAERATVNLAAARGVLERLLGPHAADLDLRAGPPQDGRDAFRISAANGRTRIQGTSTSALLFGANWYLKYVAKVNISESGDRLGTVAHYPLPSSPIEMDTPYRYRYALNENVDGYTTPYWDWPRWQREIDVLALSGIDAVIVERGTDLVLYETFRDFGYSDEEIRAWITQPAHQNWQLMGNVCCFGGPITKALLDKRAQSARDIIGRLRELGITPVLPGFYGIVPGGFGSRHPQSHIVPQGEWAGFTRPDWLDPRDPLFARVAESFYRHQRELFGDTGIYDMEVFQEGGDSGDVDVRSASRAVQEALWAAHPGAGWMMLAWQGNPRPELLAGVDRRHLFIIDIDHDRVPRDDRKKDFQGAPFLFGGLWEFGGRTTLGANLANVTDRLQRIGRTNDNMIGTALFTEGEDTNPFAFDLFTEMAWRRAPLDKAAWTRDWVERRYGRADPDALAAWQVILQTAYDIHVDAVDYHSERDAPQESLFAARPSLTVDRASHWSPGGMRYDADRFATALPLLLRAAPRLENIDHDLVDVARQVLCNQSRLLLPRIKAAYEARDRAAFDALTARWLHLMDVEDDLLATEPSFLLGRWLAPVAPWASTPDEAQRLDYDARALLTTWGDRKASDAASLHDYGNKDWAGLTRDFYRMRWQIYFKSLAEALRTGQAPADIDWYALEDAWNRASKPYPDRPHGDARAMAAQVVEALR